MGYGDGPTGKDNWHARSCCFCWYIISEQHGPGLCQRGGLDVIFGVAPFAATLQTFFDLALFNSWHCAMVLVPPHLWGAGAYLWCACVRVHSFHFGRGQP